MTRVSPMTGIGIAGVGTAAERGGRRVDNDEVDALVRTNGAEPMPRDDLQRAGWDSRWWTARPGGAALPGAPTTEDLLTAAVDAALDDAGVTAAQVDVLIAATTTPNRLTSCMATVAGGRLGIRGMALDVRAGCPSALHGLVVAAAQLAAGAEVAVVAAAETLSRVAPGTGPIAHAAGDGGGAVVLTRNDDARRGILGGTLGSDGSLADLVGAPGTLPPTKEQLERDAYRIGFGGGYGAAAAAAWRSIGERGLSSAATAADRITSVVANQAGRHRLQAAAAAAGIDGRLVVDVGSRTANSGSASFMAALAAADRGDDRTWLLASVGGGLSFGAVVMVP